MTIEEVKYNIANANDIEWFKNIQVKFNFSYAEYQQTFIGLAAIYEFVYQQCLGWEELKNSIPNDLAHSFTYFTSIRNSIIEFVDNNTKADQNQLNHQWSNVTYHIDNINRKPLTYDSPYSIFLIKVYKESSQYFSGAYNFLLNTNNYNVNDRDTFFGAILAYEFSLKGKTDITSRLEHEKKSLSELKSEFQNYLNRAEASLVEHIRTTSDFCNDFIKKSESDKNEKDAVFKEWFTQIKSNDWGPWFDEKKESLKKLEDTYESKLKLEKPARYWQMKARIYYEQGTITRNIIIAVVAFVSAFLAVILITAPDWIFKNVFKDNSTAIVRWSIVLLIFISLIAYTIKALTKYMFSSFHLARDAEERHALTFFYLALTKDTGVKDEDRQLILQSLFSRSDTGLLKEDSSPTMPSDTISKIVSNRG